MMAAMKLIKLGVKVIGRPKVVGFVAKLLAKLIQGMVGEQAARILSQHIADAGLRLLGLEAERSDRRRSAPRPWSRPPRTPSARCCRCPRSRWTTSCCWRPPCRRRSTAAAVRHFPAEVLRPELTESSEAEDGERGIWIMFPRVGPAALPVQEVHRDPSRCRSPVRWPGR